MISATASIVSGVGRRRLEDDRVPGGDGRGDLVRREVEREVERADRRRSDRSGSAG